MPNSPHITPPSSPRINNEASLVTVPNTQNGFATGRDTTLNQAAQQIFRPDHAVQAAREQRDQALDRLIDTSEAGRQLVDEAMAAFRSSEHQSRQITEELLDQSKLVLNHTLRALGENLQAGLGAARASSYFRRNRREVMRDHYLENKRIMSIASEANNALQISCEKQHQQLAEARATRAENSSLIFDTLERHVRMQRMLLEGVSEELRRECEFKFNTIRLAIEFAQKVQAEMEKNSNLLEREKDNESRRKIEEAQQEAARERAMTELNMSQEAARRASNLLSQKESLAHSVKQVELSIQRDRERMNHERCTKRYFSIWRFLFG